MPASFQPVFEFLFKYRPLVFAKGKLAFLTPWPAAAAAAIALLIAAPALLSYRGARGKTRPLDRVLLPAFRALALTLLFACLLRPTLLLSTVVPQQSFVGVMIDDSKSLRIEDVGAPRSDFVSKVLADPANPLRRALEARFKLRFFRFA